MALTTNGSGNLDFTNAPGVSLGAIGTVSFSGSLTPAPSTYRLGGGGGTLTVSGNLGDEGGPTALVANGGGIGGT